MPEEEKDKAEMLMQVFVDMYENEMDEAVDETVKSFLVQSLVSAHTSDGKTLDLDRLLKLAYWQNASFRTFMKVLSTLLIEIDKEGKVSENFYEKFHDVFK